MYMCVAGEGSEAENDSIRGKPEVVPSMLGNIAPFYSMPPRRASLLPIMRDDVGLSPAQPLSHCG